MAAINCKNCKHSRWHLTPTGRISRNVAGRCSVENPKAAVVDNVPSCCMLNRMAHRQVIWPDGGTDCPLFESNDGVNLPIAGSEPNVGMFEIQIIRQKSSK